MYRILTGSKDAYITDKIITNDFRATDANTGQAATIDLFKLYGESLSGSNSSPIEISRGLVKFDLNPLRKLTGSFLDIGHSSFKCTLKMFDVYGGQTCPSNFKLIVFPLSRSFDEGMGRDIVTFADLDSCNFISSSFTDSEDSTAATATVTVDGTGLVDLETFTLVDANGGSHVFTIDTGSDVVTNNSIGVQSAVLVSVAACAVQIAASINDSTATTKGKITADDVGAIVTCTQLVKGAQGNRTNTGSPTNMTIGSFAGGLGIDGWSSPGANKQGLLNSNDIDIISSGNLNDGNGIVDLWKSQTFSTGEEDLAVDVTTIISATLKNIIPDKGFRISYSGSEETDKVTRFVKRFASIQTSNYAKRPSLVVQYNNTIQDHHKSFFFNMSGSLFLNNFHRGSFSNILTGTRGKMHGISGSNSLLLRMTSGSKARGTFFEKYITASQHIIGQNHISGVYSASFCIPSFTGTNPPFQNTVQFNSSLVNEIKNAGSATFTEIWSSLDRTVSFLTGSVVVNTVDRSSFENQSKRLLVTITNMQPVFTQYQSVKFRVFAEDVDRPVKYKKVPFVTPSQIFTSMFYRVRDVVSGNIIIPFDTANNGTLCSTDSDGMYFELYMDSLSLGRLYTIDFLIQDRGFDQIFTDVASKFRITQE